MICKQCNKEFNPSIHRRKYCSQECAKIYLKEYKKNYSQSEGQKKYRQSDERKNHVREYLKSDERKKYRREYQKKWVQTDKGKNANEKSQKKYQQSDKYKKYQKEHRQSDKGKETLKKYRQSDKAKAIHNKSKKKYQNERRKSDPLYKLTANVRSRLYSFLKINSITKKNKTFVMVGCTPKFLKEYLEKQFKPGMSWQNHTKTGWHIDHIKPLNKAKTPEAVEKLMHYSNLQPLWATENLKKGDKY